MKHVFKVVALAGVACLGYLLGSSITASRYAKDEDFDDDCDFDMADLEDEELEPMDTDISVEFEDEYDSPDADEFFGDEYYDDDEYED